MKKLRLSEIVKQIDGRVVHGIDDPVIKGVIKKTKKDIEDNTLLFHVKRDSINGKYWENNLSLAVVTDSPEMCRELHDQISIVIVNNVEEAYWKFVHYYRNLFQIPIIGVTGTCGKTTTKEMITQILEQDYNVESTWMSMNSMSVNLRYLLRIEEDTEMAVYEMPVAYPGYLKVACQYFQPQIRILLNIDVHHLADCETPEVYMKAKGEIIEGLDHEEGILILNSDDENIKKVVDVTPFKHVIYFGKGEDAQFQAEEIQYGDKGMKFILKHKGHSYEAYVPGFGEHNVYNALATLAAVSSVGIDLKTAIDRLTEFEHVEEHLEFKEGVNGCTVIDDTWNSSPLSMKTALKVLKEVSEKGTSIALLGYMPQLGDGKYAIDEYRQLGEKVVENGIDILVVAGKEAESIGIRAIELGMDKSKVHFCETGKDILNILSDKLAKDTVVLLKITYRVMKRPSFQELKKYLIPKNDE